MIEGVSLKGAYVMSQVAGMTSSWYVVILNFHTFIYAERRITSAIGHLLVYYKDALLYDKKFNLCLEIADLDPRYRCPIEKGTIFQFSNNAIEMATMKIWNIIGKYSLVTLESACMNDHARIMLCLYERPCTNYVVLVWTTMH